MTIMFNMTREATPDRLDFGTIRWLSRPSSTGAKQLAVMDVVLAPGKAHAFHVHPDQEETIYIVSGRVEQWVEAEKRILGAGDSVFLPAGQVHGSYNTGKEDVRMVVIFGPCVGDGFQAIEVADQAPWNALRTEVAA